MLGCQQLKADVGRAQEVTPGYGESGSPFPQRCTHWQAALAHTGVCPCMCTQAQAALIKCRGHRIWRVNLERKNELRRYRTEKAYKKLMQLMQFYIYVSKEYKQIRSFWFNTKWKTKKWHNYICLQKGHRKEATPRPSVFLWVRDSWFMHL